MLKEQLKEYAEAIFSKYDTHVEAGEAVQISPHSLRKAVAGQSLCTESNRRIQVAGIRVMNGFNPKPEWKKGDEAIISCARSMANKKKNDSYTPHNKTTATFSRPLDFTGAIIDDSVPEEAEYGTQDDIYELKKIGGQYMIRIAKLGDKSVYCPAIVRADPEATNTQFVIQ